MSKIILLLFAIFLLVPSSFSLERGLYVDVFDTILGNLTAENNLISFALGRAFSYLCLYDIGLLLDSGRASDLSQFISKARSQGIKEIGAAGGWTGHFDLFSSYQASYSTEPSKQLDVFNLESEFWNEADVTTAFTNWLSLANYMKKKAGTKKIEAYLGQKSSTITKSRLSSILKIGFNRLLLSCYSSNSQIDQILNNCQTVYDNLNAAALGLSKNQTIYPIFSVEPDFFGGNINVPLVEANFTSAFSKRYGAKPYMDIQGFQFFAYSEFSY